MNIYSIPGFSEPFSSFSHLFVTPLFLLFGILLIIRCKGGFGYRVAIGIFVFATLFMLSMSGVYHLLTPGGAGREVLWRLDHAAIFVLIAGTLTPVHTLLFKGWGRWGMLLLAWGITATAVSLKTVFFHSMPEWLSLSLYLGFGWLGLFSGIALYRRHDYAFIKPLLYGGLAYSVGAVLEFLRQPILINGVIGPHELFHVAVLFGLGFHWLFIWRISVHNE
jgi:channel protein (hemolysin III family)